LAGNPRLYGLVAPPSTIDVVLPTLTDPRWCQCDGGSFRRGGKSGAAGTELLRPAAEGRLRMWPVSRRVNRTGGGDDPALIAEIAM
jgi:hypothetical protein